MKTACDVAREINAALYNDSMIKAAHEQLVIAIILDGQLPNEDELELLVIGEYCDKFPNTTRVIEDLF